MYTVRPNPLIPVRACADVANAQCHVQSTDSASLLCTAALEKEKDTAEAALNKSVDQLKTVHSEMTQAQTELAGLRPKMDGAVSKLATMEKQMQKLEEEKTLAEDVVLQLKAAQVHLEMCWDVQQSVAHI